MSNCVLIRRVRFPATHHYRRSDWSDDRNRRAFGALALPHAHEYLLELRVSGEGDPETGFVVELGALDGAIEEVVGPLRGRDLTEAIPDARERGMLTSTENLARWFFREISRRLPAGVRLSLVRVAESDELAAECSGP